MTGDRRIPRYREECADEPESDERQVDVRQFEHAHAVPDTGGDQRHRKRALRACQRRRRERASREKQHAAGEIVAEVVHLADKRDRRAEYDRANSGREIGEVRTLCPVEPRADDVSASDAGEQNAEAERTRDRRPVGGDEGEESSGDQQPADDRDHGGDGDAFGRRPQRAADGLGGGRRDHAFGLPARKIGVQPPPIGTFGHRFGPASGPKGEFQRCCYHIFGQMVTCVPTSTTRPVGMWK